MNNCKPYVQNFFNEVSLFFMILKYRLFLYIISTINCKITLMILAKGKNIFCYFLLKIILDKSILKYFFLVLILNHYYKNNVESQIYFIESYKWRISIFSPAFIWHTINNNKFLRDIQRLFYCRH